MIANLSVSIILDTRRIKQKTQKYPVKLRVYYQKEPRLYTTTFELTEAEFESLSAKRVNDNLQEIRDSLKKLTADATVAAGNGQTFSFSGFEKEFILNHPKIVQKKSLLNIPELQEDFDFADYKKRFSIFQEDHSDPGTISGVYFYYVKELIIQKRIGTALSYQSSYISLKKFRGNIRFNEITTGYLFQYEDWMLTEGRSISTVGMNIRTLRAIFNLADHLGIIRKANTYPFGKRKYIIPTSKNIKKALTMDVINKIYYDTPSCEGERKAKAFWFFCYYANGMNIKDVARLKYKNIQGDFIVFERAKTSRSTRSNPRPIVVYLVEELLEIITEWGNTDKNPENYIFPILSSGLSPLREYDIILQFIHVINEWMHKICKRLSIDKKATTIVTRHSFSTRMKQAGASTEFIQESLGHTDKRTTEIYLDSFENEVKKEYAKALLSFKKIAPADDDKSPD